MVKLYTHSLYHTFLLLFKIFFPFGFHEGLNLHYLVACGMVVMLITEFLVPAKTTFINKEILANFQINTINKYININRNINSQTSEKNYALCIYEFVGPLYALSQSLILQRK